MEKKGHKISSCIVRVVAEKLKNFIEDHESSFKFQPWQMVSTLSILRKVIHKSLHERAIHYLCDTGTAREILNFSKKNKISVKVQEVVEYLHSFLGISISQINPKRSIASFSKHSKKRIKSHASWHSVPKCCFSNNPVNERIFEIKKLVESVAQELAYLFSLTEENSNSTQYSWKVSRYHMTSVKKQKLVCCSYSSCLFNIRKQHWYKEHKAARNNTLKVLAKKKKKQNTSNYKKPGLVPKTLPQTRAINLRRDAASVNKTEVKLPMRRIAVNAATQTISWRQEASPSYSSSYDDTLVRVCGEEEEESYDEEELYCKSDTLNDASMITEEIASEFEVDKHNPPKNPSKLESDLNLVVTQNGKQRRRSCNDFRNQDNVKTELSNVSRSHVNSGVFSKCASSKRKLFSKDGAGNQLKVTPSTSKSPNVSSRSKTKSISSAQKVTRKEIKKVSSPQVESSKRNSSVKVKQKRTSIDNPEKGNSLSGKSKAKSSIGDTMKISDSSVKDQNSIKKKTGSLNNQDSLKNNVTVFLESPDLEHEFDIEQVKKLSQIFDRFDENGTKATAKPSLPVATSSDNETTYVPVMSSSSDNVSSEEANSNCSSSLKENDNMSPEFSSHWTEDYSSTEVSEPEVDESFKKKFITYKRSLLDDDDGIIASSEDENISSKNDEDIRDSFNQSNSEDFTTQEMLLDSIFAENIEEFRKRLEMEENLLENIDENGWNLLHLAASKGLENVLKELLNFGIPIESNTHDGYTPLKIAVSHNHLTCCKILLQNGASLMRDDGTFDKEVLEIATTSPIKRLLTKYEENLGRLKMISEVLNHFGEKKKNFSTLLSKNLLKSLADLTLEEDELATSGLS